MSVNPPYLSFKLPEEFIKDYKKKTVPWGFPIGSGNSLGELTFLTKYSRRKADGGKERWWETCERVIEGMFSIQKDWCKSNRLPWNERKAQATAQDAYDRLFNGKWTPPGRGLWMMGTEFVNGQKNSAALQNCSFLSTESISSRSVHEAVWPFVRLMEMSMLGVGVGFDTKGAGKLEIHQPLKEVKTFIIPDSREGWYESVSLLLESYFFANRHSVEFDYGKIRPSGQPIKGFGGVAAGPGPLMDLHKSLKEQFEGRFGERISSTDIVDIQNKIGKCVVAGNVRRSAEIALGDLNDQDFLDLKNWEVNPERMGANGWGHTSNNSIVASVGDNFDNIAGRIADNGEPGIIWLDLCREYGRLVDTPNNKDWRAAGTNPCVTSDTWVLTSDGPRMVEDLIGYSPDIIVDGKAYSPVSDGFFSTGIRDVFEIVTNKGYRVKVTEEHPIMTPNGWVEAKDLKLGDSIVLHNHGNFSWDGAGDNGDGYLLGLLIGDGTYMGYRDRATLCTWGDDGVESVRDYAYKALSRYDARSDWGGWSGPFGNGWYRMSNVALTQLASRFGVTADSKTVTRQIEEASSSFYEGFLSGLFDADGHVEGSKEKGVTIRLSSVDYDMILSVQRMLSRLGIMSSVHWTDRKTDFGKTDGFWRLIISSESSERFMGRVGFVDSDKSQKWHNLSEGVNHYNKPFQADVVEINHLGQYETFDITVEHIHAFDANGIYVSNCSEQTLESGECCTLVENFISRHDSLEDFQKTLKVSYLYAKSVTLLPTHWPETNAIMQRNRRIGCSVSGLAHFAEMNGWTDLRRWLDNGYDYIQALDTKYSEWLGCRLSIKTTSVKPSGTVSLLFGVTPGVHWPTADVYIRRMRLAANDPLLDALRLAGYHTEPDVMDPTHSVVVELPTVGPDVRTEREVSMWEKTALAILAQRYWADNQVSVTVTFKEDEKSQIGALLRSIDGQLKSVSMLPLLEVGGAYKQMPYERIDLEEWENQVEKVKRIDWADYYKGNSFDAEGEKFCSNDTCEI